MKETFKHKYVLKIENEETMIAIGALLGAAKEVIDDPAEREYEKGVSKEGLEGVSRLHDHVVELYRTKLVSILTAVRERGQLDEIDRLARDEENAFWRELQSL